MPVDVADTIAALDRLQVALIAASRDAVADGAEELRVLYGAFVPHDAGELAATALVTGPYPKGVATFAADIGPTTVYGRIREIGGRIPGRRGMDHKYLKWYWGGKPVFKRSVRQRGGHYLRDADAAYAIRFRDICNRRWADAIRSV